MVTAMKKGALPEVFCCLHGLGVGSAPGCSVIALQNVTLHHVDDVLHCSVCLVRETAGGPEEAL